ncbi:uncharacterized protein [Aristolochia californica]|uniref:uncharacterized protein n=1 Tax=Aristolochia californica TaxID=171875 RepID=UPI0035DC26D8
MGRHPPWPGRAATGTSYDHNSPRHRGPNPNQTSELPRPTPPPQYIKCLSKSEMDQRKAQRLCFNCDKKYLPGHLCKRLFWLEVEDSEENPQLEDEEAPEMEEPVISIHAMIVLHNANAMQVHAGIQKFMLLALVDSGSTDKFLSHAEANQLGLTIQQNSGLSVSVANREKLTSVGICSAVKFVIEGHHFAVDFLVIPFAGFDLVLGIKWLQ